MREREICAVALMSLLSVSSLSGAPSPATNLSEADKLNQQVQELFKAGKYSEAIPLATQCLHLREKTLEPDHPSTVTALNNLGLLYVKMRDYAKAEPLLQRALKIREKALGPDHPSIAPSLNTQAVLYRGMGDYAKAESLYKRALKIDEKALGPVIAGQTIAKA